jgi:hypothetical protein
VAAYRERRRAGQHKVNRAGRIMAASHRSGPCRARLPAISTLRTRVRTLIALDEYSHPAPLHCVREQALDAPSYGQVIDTVPTSRPSL